MVQSYHNYYGFPKGSLNSVNEKHEDCATREFFEETGHHIDINKHRFTKIKVKNEITNMTYIFFVINVHDGFNINTRPLDDVEITSYGWTDRKYLKDLKLSRITSKIMRMIAKN